MNYSLEKNKIIINDCSDFNIFHILECGQIFTYSKNSELDYNVFSKDKFARVVYVDNKYEIQTDDVNYFIDFFDLNTDYSKIKHELSKNINLTNAVNFGYGIRILKQDILEVIFGFIISSNNNIERIKGIMQRLRMFGEKKGDYYCFPTLDKLNSLSEDDYKSIGAGYRAKYLVKTANQLKNCNMEDTFKMDTNSLKDWLLSLCGVGPKVADCILLFGYHRATSFPVDTWIEKVYLDIFKQKKSRVNMSKDLIKYFGDLSGYAQQYLFFYKRSFDKNI